jgi:arylsulfatase A-like enzyme
VPRPNIVLTIADDQRFDMLGAASRWGVQTPALDRLAERGTWFTQAHHFGSTHGAVCAPSRAMLHTGWTLHHIPDAIRANWGDWRPQPTRTDPEAAPLLGELLRQAGYDTYGVGKWHNGRRAFARSFAGGANIFFGGMSSHFAVPVFDFDPTGEYPQAAERIGPQHSTELFTSAAVDFLRQRRPGDPPFFLYVAYTAPHDPRETLPEWHARYRPEAMHLPPNFLPEHPFDNGELRVRDEELAAHPRTPDEIRRHLADYCAMTAHLDDGLGRIHAALDEAGLRDDTVVVHTADHGLAVGQHGLMGKQNLYDHSVRVPLLAAGPGFEPGRRDDRLCYQHALFPTLLQSAGAPVPESCEFVSLHEPPRRTSVFSQYRETQRMVRDERYKLIEYRVGAAHRTQLFDLRDDPWETEDLATKVALRGQRERLRAELRRWQEATDDPLAPTRVETDADGAVS